MSTYIHIFQLGLSISNLNISSGKTELKYIYLKKHQEHNKALNTDGKIRYLQSVK